MPAAFWTSAIVSSILVLPFMVLELRNGGGFAVPLFVVMWLLPLSFVLLFAPLVRTLRTGNKSVAGYLWLLPRVTLMALIAFLWVGIVVDQMPCFLGVPNCD
jgi:hypothetical protein